MLSKLAEYYRLAIEDWADPRAKNFFLVKSPFPILAIIIFYNYFIYKLGPRLMENRKPFNIKKILVGYNAIQIIMCGICVYRHTRYALYYYNPLCEPIDYSNSYHAVTVLNTVWFYFMIKLIDLLDTVFFVLRKKYNQISFLHMYHHNGMVIFGWIATKYLGGGHGCLMGYLNSIVHVVMYFYYLLTAWDKKYQNNIWWKKHLTQLQILQFLVVTVHLLLVLFQPKCEYPRWIVYALLPLNGLLMYLFINFYIKAYLTKKTTETKVANHKTS